MAASIGEIHDGVVLSEYNIDLAPRTEYDIDEEYYFAAISAEMKKGA